MSGEMWIVDLISFLGMGYGRRMDVSIGREVQLVSHGTSLLQCSKKAKKTWRKLHILAHG